MVPTLSVGKCGNDPNCTSDCTDPTAACSDCDEGFLLNDTNKYCYECLVTNCKKCSDTRRDVCDECITGYTVVDDVCQRNPEIVNCTVYKNFEGTIGC